VSQGEATFRVNIDGNASVASKDIASSARLAAKSIAAYEDEVKVLSADLRRLRGNSDDVTAAKSALKKRIDEAKASTSLLTAALAKQGTTYAAAAAAAKKYGDGVGKLPNLRKGIAKAATAAGGAVAPALAKGAKALAPIGKKLGAFAAPITKAVVDKLAPAGRFIAKFGGGAAKSLGKLGKAAKEDVGSILPAIGKALAAFGPEIAIIAAGVAAAGGAFVAAAIAVGAFGLAAADAAAKASRQRQALGWSAKSAENYADQINELAGKTALGTSELNAMAVALSKTRLTGKAQVATMNAVAQATSAIDESAGSKIQELITRGQTSGRFFLGQLELQGTGIDFDDVAKEYAAGMHKSVDAARKELMTGQVPIEEAANTLARVTEKKFGKLNIANAFSLENAPKKFYEQLQHLSKDVDLGPISKALQSAFGQFDESAPLGGAIKTFMSTFGTGLVDIAAKSIPILVEALEDLVIWSLRVTLTYYEMKKQIKDAFAGEDWVGIGAAIIKGLAKGIANTMNLQGDVLFGIGKSIKNALTDELKIHSPSKVFEGYGSNTVEGYAQGVESGSKRATGAVRDMAQGTPALPAAGAAPMSIEVNIHGASTASAQDMQSPQFLSALTRALRDAVTQSGGVVAA